MYPEPPEGFRVVARIENHPDDPPNVVRKYFVLESPDGARLAWDGAFFRRLPDDWKTRCRWRAVSAKPITFSVPQDVEPRPRRARVARAIFIFVVGFWICVGWLVCGPRGPRMVHTPAFPAQDFAAVEDR
jgi:hypothetical protein